MAHGTRVETGKEKKERMGKEEKGKEKERPDQSMPGGVQKSRREERKRWERERKPQKFWEVFQDEALLWLERGAIKHQATAQIAEK